MRLARVILDHHVQIMTSSAHHLPKAFLILAAILASAVISRAAITLTIEEIGTDVEASYTGTLDTTNLLFSPSSVPTDSLVAPSVPSFYATSSEKKGLQYNCTYRRLSDRVG